MIPMRSITHQTVEDIFSGAIELAQAKQYVDSGDIVVITAGIPSSNIKMSLREGDSNMMRIARVE